MADELKLRAAEAALDYVENGMRLGLGTGATASAFVRLLGNRVAAGLDIVAVATSGGTARLADECRIRMTTLDETPELDIAIDGADEIGPGLAMIKGGGGALLREKIVAAAARRMIVIADEAKRVEMLGAFPLPIEVAGFGHAATVRAIEKAAAALGLEGAIRRRMRDGAAYLTDGGNGIVDASFGRIPDPEALANRLAGIPGVIEHGLFLGYADIALVASADGVTTITA